MPINVTYSDSSGNIVATQTDIPLPFETSPIPSIQSTVDGGLLFSSGEYASAISGVSNIKYIKTDNSLQYYDGSDRLTYPVDNSKKFGFIIGDNYGTEKIDSKIFSHKKQATNSVITELIKFLAIDSTPKLMVTGFKCDYNLVLLDTGIAAASRMGTIMCSWDLDTSVHPVLFETSVTSDVANKGLAKVVFDARFEPSGSNYNVKLRADAGAVSYNTIFSGLFTTFYSTY